MAKFVFPSVKNAFTPTTGQEYWSINGNDLVIRRTWNNYDVDKTRLRHNNVFGSLKAAKTVRAAIVAAKVAAQKA